MQRFDSLPHFFIYCVRAHMPVGVCMGTVLWMSGDNLQASSHGHWRNPDCWPWVPWWEGSSPLTLFAHWFFSFFFFWYRVSTLWLRCLQFITVLLPQVPHCWGYKLHWLMFSILCRYLTTPDLTFFFFWSLWINFSKSCQTAFQSGLMFTLHQM